MHYLLRFVTRKQYRKNKARGGKAKQKKRQWYRHYQQVDAVMEDSQQILGANESDVDKEARQKACSTGKIIRRFQRPELIKELKTGAHKCWVERLSKQGRAVV